MESIVQALGGILLKALPTFFLVVLLHFYLKYMFFGPLEKVLHRRYELSEGARLAAEESLRRATAKTEEYEAALRAARAEVFQQQEQFHRDLQQDRDTAVAQARSEADAAVQRAKAGLAADVQSARNTLGAQSEALAEQISNTLLPRRAA
jgi:F-type H+-transporting ATPase subunit b